MFRNLLKKFAGRRRLQNQENCPPEEKGADTAPDDMQTYREYA